MISRRLVLSVLLPGVAGAQSASLPVRAPRPIGPIVARAAESFASVSRLFTLRGSVFLNDPTARQVMMLDSNLVRVRVVLDSAAGRPNSYITPYGGSALHRFRGDSAWFAPGPAVEAIIFGPDGRIARVAPTPQAGGPCQLMDVDDLGWVTCERPLNPPGPDMTAVRAVTATGRDTTVATRGDSGIVVAINFTTWRVDTIGRLRAPAWASRTTYLAGGFRSPRVIVPIQSVDGWTSLRDGTLAIVRAVDYRLEFFPTTGPVVRGPRVPYAWRPITEANQRTILDSLQRRDSLEQVRLDSAAAARGRGGRGASARVRPIIDDPVNWPTYWPAFYHPTFTADEDNRLWLRERLAPAADTVAVYAVFNRQGELVDRVSVPMAYAIAGFGPGGAVYLTSQDGGRTLLAKARFR